jgi:hypothetical protein
VDDDPVLHAVKIDKVSPDPPSLPIGTPRQAQLIPPAAISSTTIPNSEDDLELRVGPELLHHAYTPRVRTRRSPNHHPRRKQLTRRGQPHSRPASRMQRRGGDKQNDYTEADRPDTASNASPHRQI